jgi:Protein of unknown function (DUF2795)
MPMSEQVSATHGPAEDDQIKRQDRTELQEHGDEWPDPEDSSDWPFQGTWAPEGRFARTPEGPDFLGIELRSEMARHLDRTTFPATREQLLRTLIARQADQPVVDLVTALSPRTTVDNVGDLIRATGLPIEERGA